jgi:hypothetical protein
VEDPGLVVIEPDDGVEVGHRDAPRYSLQAGAIIAGRRSAER